MENISIVPFEECTGCNACLQICSKHCIQHERKAGFWYPKVNEDVCIGCGKCMKVCPVIKPLPQRVPLECFAGYNKNEDTRLKSSSGGVFMVLAEYVLNHDGIVFGAVFDESWNVKHVYSMTAEGVRPMLGSKYLQSDIINTFIQCKSFLKSNKLVLYSGTPCQIEGLHKFLGKNYDNLLTMDFICHGVPSPGIWQQYLKETFGYDAAVKAADGKNTVLNSSLNTTSPIGDIRFRDKTDGWEKYRFVVSKESAFKADKNSVLLSDTYSNNPYMRGFLNDLYLRESCYHCPARCFSSQSDITIGDFWGVHKLNMDDMNDQKGLSVITLNSEKGKGVFNKVIQNFVLRELTLGQVVESNSNLVHIAKKDIEKVEKFNENVKTMTLIDAIDKTLHVSLTKRIILKIKYKLGFVNE